MVARQAMLQLFGKLFLAGIAVNLPWEMAQAYLYAPMGDWVTATIRCFGAAVVDGAIVLGIAAAGAAAFRQGDWFRQLDIARTAFSAATGGGVAVAIEYFSLKAGRWDYEPLMPIIPYLGVGLVPVIQLMILPLLVFRMARGFRSVGFGA
jgi:hypothetical protein